ncbi:transcriptional regulator [Nocardiopsis terrae]|uniref:Transcriptional regulator with XRE-family HTH domain n=1 Tax=Nocardiopsis terrae TaxID=372655 RepID=A0ABR9HIP8_9ACTN|nr:helix-turn-helix transcriptional regulator [Nocardiopsis terrae]MBE1458902.1 transcriptional regulator with XRE-family HTH domain [Nocardiopsis terrae]GHC87011.1 transcriptional regulator [Nocardiopsis terrae]
MAIERSPSLRLRRLAAELRRAREQADLTGSQAAKKLQWSAGKLSKIEKTETKRITSGDIDKMLDLYEVNDSQAREAMHALAKDAKLRGWWSKYKDVFGDRALPDFEAEASVIRTFTTQTIPGLLQTPGYAEAIFQGGRYVSPEEIRRRLEFRMERREILTRFRPVQLRAVIDEAALRRQIGDTKTMCEQLGHLLYMAQLPNIDIQVLPFSAGAHAALAAPFTILEFWDPLDTPIVYVGTVTDALFIEEADNVTQYSATFGDVQGSSLSTARSAAFIKEVAATQESDT